jgi:hypothetical protein
MKIVILEVYIDDDFSIDSVIISHNDTGLPTNSKLLHGIVEALLSSINNNKDELDLYDELNDIGIGKPNKEPND